MTTIERIYTTTTKFLLRPLGLVKKTEKLSTSKLKGFGFLNAFVKDMNHETIYTHPVYMLFKQDHPNLDFRAFVNEEYERGLLLEDYDYPESHIVLVYDYPDEFKTDYEKIMEGKYSETSKAFQACFPETEVLTAIPEPSMYTLVFNKSKELRKALEEEWGTKFPDDSEVRTVPFLPNETLDINKYI